MTSVNDDLHAETHNPICRGYSSKYIKSNITQSGIVLCETETILQDLIDMSNNKLSPTTPLVVQLVAVSAGNRTNRL